MFYRNYNKLQWSKRNIHQGLEFVRTEAIEIF